MGSMSGRSSGTPLLMAQCRYRCNRPDHMVQFADGTAIFADSKGKWSAFEHECSRQNLAKMRGQMEGAFRGALHDGPPVVGAIIVVQGGAGTAGNLVSSYTRPVSARSSDIRSRPCQLRETILRRIITSSS